MKLIPLNDTSRTVQPIQAQLMVASERVIASGYWLQGKETALFEEKFARYCGTTYCTSVANGTDALELALRAVSMTNKSKKKVITVANAGGYTTTACMLCDLYPVYVDVNEDNLLVNIDMLIKHMSDDVLAIVVTHLYGGIVDVNEIKSRIKEAGYSSVSIIEDCAQAHGGKIGNSRVGSLGDIATFSFYPTKNLGAIGDAGAITTSSLSLNDKVKVLKQYGWSNKYNVATNKGRNSRMDEIQAAFLSILMDNLDEMNDKRKYIVHSYREAVKKNPFITFLSYQNDFVGHLAICKVAKRSEFIDYLKNKMIACDIHYPILDTEQLAWLALQEQSDENTELPVSKTSTSVIVSLPCFPQLHDDEIAYICQAIANWEPMR